MKNTIILILVLLSFSSFGQRVMTQEEKYSLAGSSDFIEKCKQSVRDFATYWSVHDGAGFSTEADRIAWAKNRQLAVNILKHPEVNDPLITWIFLNAAKGKTYNLGAAPQSASTLVAAWVAASSFDEFANEYYKILGDDINFSIGN